MAEMNQPFSDRYGYRESSEPEITVREDAPEAIREGLIVVAQETGMATGGLLRIACKALRKIRKSDDNFNYTFEDELHEIITNAKWYRIYDICEKIYDFLIGYGNSDPRADESSQPGIRLRITQRGIEGFAPVSVDDGIAVRVQHCAGNRGSGCRRTRGPSRCGATRRGPRRRRCRGGR